MLNGFADFRQTAQYARFMEKSGWSVLRSKHYTTDQKPCYLFLWDIPIVGSKYLSLHRVPPRLDVTKVIDFAKARNVSIIRVDFNAQRLTRNTTQLLNKHGFTQTSWCNSPTKTKILSLQKDPISKIFKQLKSKLRYNIRLARKRGCVVQFFSYKDLENKQDIFEQFSNLLCERRKLRGLEAMTAEQLSLLMRCFGNNARMGVAMENKKVISAAIFLMSKSVISYTQNFSSPEGKKIFAPSLILWEAIRLGKNLKLKYLDFEGITDERNLELTQTWTGFSRFKNGFVGSDMEMVLPYQKIFGGDNAFERMRRFFIRNYLRKKVLPSIYPSNIYI